MKSFHLIESACFPTRELARKFKSILNDRPSAIRAGRLDRYKSEDGKWYWDVEIGYNYAYVDNLMKILLKESNKNK